MLRFRRLEAQPGLRFLDRLLNAKVAALEVHVLPAERQELAAAHAGGKSHRRDDVEEAAAQAA